MPDLVGVFGQHDALELALAGRIEETQLDACRMRREQREVHAEPVPRRAERLGQTFHHARAACAPAPGAPRDFSFSFRHIGASFRVAARHLASAGPGRDDGTLNAHRRAPNTSYGAAWSGAVYSSLLILAVLIGGAFVALAWRLRSRPIEPPARSAFDRRSIERGTTLAAIGGCVSCHTAPQGKPYAGGLPFKTPFGTIHGTNITPDPETGIGRWSEAAFVRAMREGVSRDGRHLYPVFPYDHYTRVADDDVRAIYAFLMTREPVRAETPDERSRLPAEHPHARRRLEAALLRRRSAFSPIPARAPSGIAARIWPKAWVTAASCHTPRNFLGAPKKRLHLAGGEVEGWHAPALNASSRTPVPWSAEALERYLTRGVERGPRSRRRAR